MTTSLDRPVAFADDQDDAVVPELPRRWRVAMTYGAVALIAFLMLGLRTKGGVETSFRLASDNPDKYLEGSERVKPEYFLIPDFSVPSRPLALALTLAALAIAGYVAWLTYHRRKSSWWVPLLFGLVVIAALLTWAGAGKDNTTMNVNGLLSGGLVLSVPLVFGALAGTLSERSGVVNIAIEGQLLFGAFLAAVAAGATGNAYVGLIAAPIAGVLVASLLALFAVRYWVDQIVVGVVLNVLVVGITSFLYGTLLRSSTNLNQAKGIPDLAIPVLSKIPIVGPILFDRNLLVYLMYVIVIVAHIMLFKSRWGLRVRAVGEHPKAADTVGIKVNRTRVRTTLLGGAVAGLGGAFFTVASGLAFGKEMTGGKGFIALAAMILGRWSPKGALFAALLFGFAESLKDQFGIVGTVIPSQFLTMLPYLATLFAVAGLVGHAKAPAADGVPYKK